MSLANSGKRCLPASVCWSLYSAAKRALRLTPLPTSLSLRVSMIEITGAVVVFTLATSTHTSFGAPANGVTHAGSCKPLQSSTVLQAVVVTFAPSGPLGDAHTDTT